MPANGVVVSINNAAGVVINGSGVSTTGRTTDGTPATVTINNFPSSLNGETLAAGVGLLVTATSTANTYNYHKILVAESDVKQLSDDINDFNSRYRIASSAPGSNNDEGDLYFDTGANKMKVYNGSAWDDVASVGSFFINTISSSSGTGGGSATFNGSAYRFTLSNPGTAAQQLIVSVNGVIQKPNSGTSQPSEGFAIDGSDIIFSAAPASGADYFIITQGSSVSIGTPSANSVNSSHIIDGSITNADISSSAAIAGSKLDITIPGGANGLDLNDSVKAQFGASNDLQIYHDGTTNRIDAASGNLHIKASNLSLKSYANETYLDATANGAVEIFFNNRKTAETLTSGFRVSSPDGDAQLQIFGFEGSDAILKLGADEGDDNPDWYQIIHDHSDTNSLRIQNYADGAYEDNIICRHGAGVELYYDAGSPSFETTSTGAKVTGTIEAGAASVTDDGSTGPVINISGDDSNVWFGRLGNESYHDNVGTGFKFYVTNDGHAQFYHTGNAEYRNWLIGSYDGTTYKTDIYKVASSGNLALYQDGNIRLTTTTAGISVTGSVTDSTGELRTIVQNTQAGAYTLVAADAGKHILASGNITVPDSVFSAGQAITIVNNTAGNLTITKGTNMYNTADGTNANRTLATRGMATLLFTAADTAYISGAGLS